MRKVGDLIPIGGSGDAVSSDLLSGKTASTDNGEITGTMPDLSDSTYYGDWGNGTDVDGDTVVKVYPETGYHDWDSTTIELYEANLAPENIKLGTSIFGVDGTLEAGGPSIKRASGTTTAVLYDNDFDIQTGFRVRGGKLSVTNTDGVSYETVFFVDDSYEVMNGSLDGGFSKVNVYLTYADFVTVFHTAQRDTMLPITYDFYGWDD